MKLEELKKLCDEATPGPWRYSCCYGVATIESPSGDVAHAVEYLKTSDADLIAAARTYMPKLIAVAEAAREDVRTEALLDALNALGAE